jgi:hypothetical protein
MNARAVATANAFVSFVRVRARVVAVAVLDPGYRLEHRLVSGLLIRVAPAMRAEADR